MAILVLNQTPLHRAAMSDDAAEVTTLLEAGVSTDVRDKDGRTPLHLAFRDEFAGEAVAVLLNPCVVSVGA